MKQLRWPDIQQLLKTLQAEGYQVLVPKKNAWGDWFPEEGIPEAWPEDFENYLFPFLRDLVLPSPEPVFETRNGELCEAHTLEFGKIAFFGARACDATALAYTDHFYLERTVRDEHYARRREQLVVITVACTRPCEDSFCLTMEAGPWARRGFDVQLYPRRDAPWLAEAGSSIGERLLAPFADAPEQARDQWLQEVLPRFEKLDRSKLRYPIDPETRQYLADRCFACGGCIWLCPTCTCYNERTLPGTPTVVREQDACLLTGYHRMAKGASLRPTLNEMMGFRYECKLGIGSCVGCGRCSVTCIGHAAMEAYLERVR